MSETEIYFELSEGSDFIKLTPLYYNFPDATDDWDGNWIKTKVEIKAGSFSGSYKADLMTVDFERFKRALTVLYDNLNGTAKLKPLENYLEMQIEGDGLGHFETQIRTNDSGDIYGANLSFTLFFDQTRIKEMVNQLNKITTKFPVTGNLKIN